jgi:uncharacterized protein
MSLLLALILVIVLFMISLSLVLFVIGPIMLLQPHRRTIDYYRRITTSLHPGDLALRYEEMVLKTAEGIGLNCWLIFASEARGTIIYLHGVSECKIVGLPMAKLLSDNGFNVFLYDSRRHGDSGGKYCTYGFYEKHDVTTAINYLERRTDIDLGNIGLFGSSMGAAVAVQAAALDRRVKAVIAESGFGTLRTIFDDYQKRMIKMPWHYLRNLVIKRSEHLAHFKASAVSPLEAVKTVHVPIFILHGTADDLIKYQYSELLYESAGLPKELWLIKGAKHNDMAEIGGKEYARRVVDFFKKNL